MQALTVAKKKNKLEFTPAQATFNKHRRKIDKLRSQTNTLKLDFDTALEQYHSKLLPLNRKAAELITKYLLELIALTSPKKALDSEEREALDVILEQDINVIFNLLPHAEVHDEIKKLHEKIHGISTTEAFYEQISKIKDAFREQAGVEDIDFSHLNPNDSLHESLQKIAEAAAKASSSNEKASPPPPRKKTKKELLKEEKTQQLEALQNKSLNTIYKQLAKEIHPDLEQDPKIRKEKEEVMKRLTTAYESNDLTTLLTLQCEWIDNKERVEGKATDETFRIYNSILKDQIEMLQYERDILFMHPRYLELMIYVEDTPLDPLEGMSTACSDVEDLFEKYTVRWSDVRRPNALKILKEILENLMDQNSFMDDPEFYLLEAMMSEGAFK